jgi:tetratricopeptide (TPR) repeat protein
LVAVAFCLCNSLAIAGDAGRESPFSVGAGARALAMGSGFTSVADDATAVFYNPAGLSLLEFQQVSFMHMVLFEGTEYNFASWAYPTPSLGGFGVAYMRIGVNDIVKRSNFVEVGNFDFSHSQFLVSYGRQLPGDLAIGLSLKIVNQELEDYSDYGIGLDLGIFGHLTDVVSAGIIVRDMIPPTLQIDTADEVTPVSVAGGLSLQDIDLSQRLRLTASFELEKVEDKSARIHTGAEVIVDESYALRAGYDRDNLSFGAGITFHRLKVDYAYKFLDYIEDSHRFSVSFLVGNSVSDQLRHRELEEQQKGTALLADERQRQFDFYKEKADRFYYQFRLDSALTYYHRALAFDEGNEEIIGTIAAIENARRIQLERERQLYQTGLEFQKTIEAYYTQAQSFFAKKYYAAALDMLELIFDINPNHPEAEALKSEIEQALAAEIVFNLEIALAGEREGNYLRSLEAYERILDLDPANQEAQRAIQRVAKSLDQIQQLNEGIELFKAGKYREARKRFVVMLAIDPSDPVAGEYIKRIDEALAKPPTLEDIQKDKVIWQLYLDGLRHMRDKEYEKAIEAWEKVLQAYPNNSETVNNLEQARLRLRSEQGE